jgi:polyhydroxyalkanoic acid synthase PhaR subunit
MAEEVAKDKTSVSMLDPFQIWKRLYFGFEDSMSKTVRDSVTTDSFANGIDLILNSYLQYLKLQNDFVSRYMEDSPFFSKRDVARVAELVVSLENKVDILEGDLEERLTEIERQTSALGQQLSAQPNVMTAADFSKLFNPAMTAVQDLGKRVSSLEKLVKQVDANFTAMNKPAKAEADKKKAPAAPAAKAPRKPKPLTKPTE